MRLAIGQITGIEPLSVQTGTPDRIRCPEPLDPWIFGDLPDATGQLATFAVIDAGSNPGLPNRLNSASDHVRCLFKGEARETLGDAAPWLVALDPSDGLAPKLFTKASPPLAFNPPYLFLRARASLDDVASHLRKFTMVQDDRGKSVYFRFWEASILLALHQSAHLPGAARFFEIGQAWIAYPARRGEALVVHATRDSVSTSGIQEI